MSSDRPDSDPTRPFDHVGDEPPAASGPSLDPDPDPAPAPATEAITQGSTQTMPEWHSPGFPDSSSAPTPYPTASSSQMFSPPAPPAAPSSQPTAYPSSEALSYGQPMYGQPTYGQPTYGQPTYGQPTYGQPTYEQPNQPLQPPPPAALPQHWVPPVGYAGPQPVSSQTNTSALVLLIISGMLTLSCYFTLIGVAPLILAIVAMTKQNTDWEGSRRLARIGWIVLAVVGVIFVIGIIIFVVAVAASSSTGSSYSPSYN